MIDEKTKKKLLNLCTKLSNVFTDFYILKQGYIMSTDVEHPFVIQIDNESIQWFVELYGEFKILHIWDIRKFKKEYSDEGSLNYIAAVTSKTEESKILEVLTNRINEINLCSKWENFILSKNEDDNEKLLLKLFKMNNFINFKPQDIDDSPEIILTKSLLPLVSEKNYTDLYYSSRKVNSELYIIVFDFQFSLFRLYMLHNYIPIK